MVAEKKGRERKRNEVSPAQSFGEEKGNEGQFKLDASLFTVPRWHSSWRTAKRPLGATKRTEHLFLQARCYKSGAPNS